MSSQCLDFALFYIYYNIVHQWVITLMCLILDF
jgi:hypothetical protein